MISLWYLDLSIIYISIPRWPRNIAQQFACITAVITCHLSSILSSRLFAALHVHPFLSVLIHFDLFWSMFIHFLQFSSIVIHFHPLPSILSIVICFHQFSSTCHPSYPFSSISSMSIHFYPFSSILSVFVSDHHIMVLNVLSDNNTTFFLVANFLFCCTEKGGNE